MSKKREGGGARRAEAGTQTEDAPLRGDENGGSDVMCATGATDVPLRGDAIRGGVGRCAWADETGSSVAAWRARVRAAMAVLAAVVDEEAGGDATGAADATVAGDAADATDAPAPPKGGGGGESDEAAEARLRRELGCLGSGSEDDDEGV